MLQQLKFSPEAYIKKIQNIQKLQECFRKYSIQPLFCAFRTFMNYGTYVFVFTTVGMGPRNGPAKKLIDNFKI
jgi:hypothetical protein